MIPLSALAAGKGSNSKPEATVDTGAKPEATVDTGAKPEATVDTGAKPDTIGKTKQPGNTVKRESKSDDETGGEIKTEAKEDRTGSSKSNGNPKSESPKEKTPADDKRSDNGETRNIDRRESEKDKSKTAKEKKDTAALLVRTLEVTAEKDGSYLFGGKILAAEEANVSGAGVELSRSINFKKTTDLPFALKADKSSYRLKTKKLEFGVTYFYRAYVTNPQGRNFGSVYRVEIPALAETLGWWSEGEKLGAGWRKSEWFGRFRKQEGMDWVYHELLGWTYAVSDQQNGLWLWQEENGWSWTQKGAWPCLWRNKTSSWFFLLGAFEGKPIFYDYASRKIKKRTEKQDKSEKGQSAKEKDPKNGQVSKEKQGEKVSEKSIDPGKSVDSKTTEVGKVAESKEKTRKSTGSEEDDSSARETT